MNKKKVEGDKMKATSPQGRKKSQRQELWQEVAKFQQEISNLQVAETDQEMKVAHLESSLKKLQKGLLNQDGPKPEAEVRVNYYINQVGKLQEETERMKAASEKKLEFLKQLRKKADDYVAAIKSEQRRHLAAMDEMNVEMMNNLEKLKRHQQEDFWSSDPRGKLGNMPVFGRLKHELSSEKAGSEPDFLPSELSSLKTDSSYKDCNLEDQTAVQELDGESLDK